MDFSQRGSNQNQAAGQPGVPGAASTGHKSKKGGTPWMRIGMAILLFGAVIIVVALLISIVTGKTEAESKYVNTDQYQAVFLNGGQVYFGKIKTLNKDYLRLDDIYYLRVNQTVQPNQANSSQASNDVSLVKLGCELHGPQDEMLINSSQTIFWENLKTDGQVAKAVTEYKKQNPNGQKCDTAASSTPSTTTPTTTKKQ